MYGPGVSAATSRRTSSTNLNVSSLVVSSVLSWQASNFATLLVARVILGVGVGGFWAISITAAAKLVPADRVHAASSLVFGGISVGSVVSVPTGSYIAAHSDWRVAFLAASVLAVGVLLLQLFLLPRIVMKEGVNVTQFFGLLRSPRVRAILLTVIFIVAGQYSGYTFVTPYLQQLTHVDGVVLSGLLFAYGVVAVIGNFVGGALAGRNLHRTVVANVWIFLASLVVLALFAGNTIVANFDRKPFEEAMSGIYTKSVTDADLRQLIERIRQVQ